MSKISLTPMNVLILGSGYAGLTVAHRIRDYTRSVNVTIISRSAIVRENTIFPLLLTDEVKVEDTEFNAKEAMEKKGVNFVEAEVETVEDGEVKTSKGTFDYDYLFIALGGAYEENFEKIKGHEHAFMHHTLEGFLGLKKAVNEAEEGVKVFVGNARNSPIEGPSYQVALITEYLLRNKKGEVYLATQSPRGVFGPIPDPRISEIANKYFEKRRGIHLIKGKYVEEIRKDKVILNDGQEIEADIKSVLPTLSAPKTVKEFADESGFIPVSFPTFSYNERIFALGDSAKGMVGPKTARAAMVSAENSAYAFLREIGISVDKPYYSQGVLCIMESGDDGGIVRFDKNSRETKSYVLFGKQYVTIKKIYSRLLVNNAFDVPYHASLPV
ncbi:FAD-dependent oxidoreductase [Acidianus sp. HS-5]|uniref:NAD(P)/FAD-dependent oxidoreductase n=1 Tax=Acidianus sp. HS-5 TaxID=2886040 RepID=UPI001F3435A6|nr:FAD-dependent oxidoreductase [Acidianus sp. HS-5]BDC18504.1 hypothetical protein HS5_13940 [Acidianus sp. HS-5]